MDRYGKSLSDIKNIKQSFFDDNEKLLSNQLEIAKIYNQQPIRSRCKCCKADLLDSLHYESHGVEYAVCGSCGHINGLHQETEEFTHFLYAESDYGKYVYASQQDQRKYDDRIAKIYAPKSGFLLETMSEMSEPVGAIDILDIGAGAGYLVSANDDLGMHTVGIDMSKQQVEYGNLYLHNKECNSRLEVIEGDALVGRIGSFLGNIVTAIGVLEHVIDFHEILRAIKDNKHIRYLFFSVPTYGLSNFLEAVFPKVFNRHLGGYIRTSLQLTPSITYVPSMT